MYRRYGKRLFDLFFSALGLLMVGLFIIVLILLSRMNTGGRGIFKQKRIGQFGELFTIYKIRSIHATTSEISNFGRFIRKFKLDELPQLFNILIGDMSFVGPRPDIPGYYDKLQGMDRVVLKLKPGLVSRAALKYYNEEELLAQQENSLQFNDDVLFPDKVQMNVSYYYNQNLKEDLNVLLLYFKRLLKI